MSLAEMASLLNSYHLMVCPGLVSIAVAFGFSPLIFDG